MLEKMRLLNEAELDELDLDFEGVENSEIYVIELDRVIEERCDELDYNLEDEGYEILHRDYIPMATSIFAYRVYFVKE